MKWATYVLMSVLLFSFSTCAAATNRDIEEDNEQRPERFDSVDLESGIPVAQAVTPTANPIHSSTAVPVATPIFEPFRRNSSNSADSDAAVSHSLFSYLQPCILSYRDKPLTCRVISGATCLTSAALIWYGQTPSWCTNSCETITAVGAAFGALSFFVFVAICGLCDEDHYWDDPLYEEE
ncbi:MAG: hypothetical protein V4482_01525 [Pseudomonadota bacterium]